MQQFTPFKRFLAVLSVVLPLVILAAILKALGIHSLLAFPLALAAYALFFVYSFCEIMKKAALDSVPTGLRFVFAKASDFPTLDTATLEKTGLELAALGFVPLADFTLASDNAKHSPAFGRVFANREHNCMAEVSQVFPREKPPGPMACTVMSHFAGEPVALPFTRSSAVAPIPEPARAEDGKNDDLIWSLATTQRTPDAVLWALRGPRQMFSNHPTLTASQIFQRHLDKRREIEPVLDLPVATDTSLETYMVRSNGAGERLRRRLLKTPAIRFFYDYKYANKPGEWWGEYGRLARKKRRL